MSNRSCQERWGFAVLHAAAPTIERHPASLVTRFLAASLIILIDAYRRFVSPFLGRHCRFHPTCSQYALDAVARYGPLSGSARALARLARCHPLSSGGYDPVR